MALELFVSRRAAGQIDDVAEWWAANRPAAPGAVRKDLEAALALLNGRLHRPVATATHDNRMQRMALHAAAYAQHRRQHRIAGDPLMEEGLWVL